MANDAVMNVIQPSDWMSGTIPTVYSRRIYQEAMNSMLWSKFMGEEGALMPIIKKTDLVAEAGGTINIIRTLNLTGDAQTGRLKGNEEKINTQVLTTSPSLKRHGVAWEELSDKRVSFSTRERAAMLLQRRWAEQFDDDIWAAMVGTGTGFSGNAPTVVWGGDATALSDIDSTDTFDIDDIDKMREKLEENKTVPVGGAEGQYCLFIHTRQAYYLGITDAWRTYQKDADVRGIENWLFSGGKPYGGIKAFGYWNGAAIFKTNQAPTVTSTSSPSCTVAKGVMVGCEALAHAIESYTIDGEIVEGVKYAEQIDDYGNEKGIGAGASYEDKILTSENLVQIWSAANNPNA